MANTFNLQAAINHLVQNALPESIHKCAHYVCKAIQAGGLPYPSCGENGGNGYAESLHYCNILRNHGFGCIFSGYFQGVNRTPNYKAMPGDICVMSCMPFRNPTADVHNHVCMYSGNAWYSDFKQNSCFVYGSSGKKYAFWIYRYAALTNASFANLVIPAWTGGIGGFNSFGGIGDYIYNVPRHEQEDNELMFYYTSAIKNLLLEAINGYYIINKNDLKQAVHSVDIYNMNNAELLRYVNDIKINFNEKTANLINYSNTFLDSITHKEIIGDTQFSISELVVNNIGGGSGLILTGGSADIGTIIAAFTKAGVNGNEAYQYALTRFEHYKKSGGLDRAALLIKILVKNGIPFAGACACAGKSLVESGIKINSVMQMEKNQQTTNKNIRSDGYGAGIWQWTFLSAKVKFLSRALRLGFGNKGPIENYSLEEQGAILALQLKEDSKCVQYIINGTPESALCGATLEGHGWGKHGYDAVDCVKTYGVTYECIGHEQLYHTPALARTVHMSTPSMHHRFSLTTSVFLGAFLMNSTIQ